MYSGSNSFLGGNSIRPGPQQYGSSFNVGPGQPLGQPPPPQQQQQQQSPFAPQPTGYGQPQLSQQYTGFPGMPSQLTGIQPTGLQPAQGPGQLQPQFTGFPGQPPPQQSFQTGAPPMPAIPQQFQQQFSQQQQQQQPSPFSAPPQPSPFSSAPTQPTLQASTAAPAPMKPQPTGFSEMAASFHTGGASKPKAQQVQKVSNKIPNIRLSFITAQDQVKFETLFKSAVGDGQSTMSGEKARDLLLRSRLDGDSLSHIWYALQVLKRRFA